MDKSNASLQMMPRNKRRMTKLKIMHKQFSARRIIVLNLCTTTNDTKRGS